MSRLTTRLIRFALLVLGLSFSTSTFAGPFVGEPFALTNTRYALTDGAPLLASNGRDVVLFWNDGARIRAKRLESEATEPSHPVMRNTGSAYYSVAWTGSHFLVVLGQTYFTSDPTDDDIYGQLADASGEAIGAPFLIVDGGTSPRIAFDGTSVLLLFYRPGLQTDEVHALRLAPDGTRRDAASKATGVYGGLQSLASNGRSFAAVVADRFERKVVQFDRSGAMTSLTPLLTDWRGGGAIASDGERYLVADAAGGRVSTQFIEADGTVGAPIDLALHTGGEMYLTSLAWSGSRWVLAYGEDKYDGNESFVLAHLNAKTRAVEQREQGSGRVASIAGRGGRLTFAWLKDVPGPIHVAHSSISAGPDQTVSHAPAEQRLRATAAAKHGTLVLWVEGGKLHAGVRGNDGRWTENELRIAPAYGAVAASDGEGFAVLVASAYNPVLLRLDREGRLAGNEIALEEWDPQHILWTGNDYLLYTSDQQFRAATFSKSGVLSAPRAIALPASGDVMLASNGNGFYATWLLPPPFLTPPMPPMGAMGMRLGPDLTPLDAAPTVLAPDDEFTFSATAAWDGTQYVVAWTGETGLRVARVSADGELSARQTISSTYAFNAQVQPVDGGVLLDWQELPSPIATEALPYLAFLRSSRTFTTPIALRPAERRAGMNGQKVVALDNGNAALIEAAIADDAPVDGALRILMSVVTPGALPERPAAPRLTAQAQGQTIELRWSAPPQPVAGYRVEVRSEGGPWIETGSVLPADRHAVSVATGGKKLALRVRAWNDAGPGAYSDAVVVNGGKRRAAR